MVFDDVENPNWVAWLVCSQLLLKWFQLDEKNVESLGGSMIKSQVCRLLSSKKKASESMP